MQLWCVWFGRGLEALAGGSRGNGGGGGGGASVLYGDWVGVVLSALRSLPPWLISL